MTGFLKGLKCWIVNAICLGCLIVGTISCNSKEPNTPIPFEKDGFFYITALLNDSIEGRFVFDTGADGLYIDSTFLSRHPSLIKVQPQSVKMRGAGSTAHKEIVLLKDSIRVTIDKRNTQIFTDIPIFELTAINGDNIAGIIGNEFLKEQVLCVDNENSTLLILPEVNAEMYDVDIPFEYVNGRIYFSVKIKLSNGITIKPRLLMDLGCAETVILNTPYYNNKKDQIDDDITYTILHGGALGGNSRGGEFRASSISISDYSLENSIICYSLDTLGAFSNTHYDGLLGNAILDRFNFAIDYKNNKLYLSKNNKYDEPFLSTSLGFYAMKRGAFATVESIYDQCEAFQNGLQLGDTIIKINNREVAEILDNEFNDFLKSEKPTRLIILRDQKEISISFTPKYLL